MLGRSKAFLGVEIGMDAWDHGVSRSDGRVILSVEEGKQWGQIPSYNLDSAKAIFSLLPGML